MQARTSKVLILVVLAAVSAACKDDKKAAGGGGTAASAAQSEDLAYLPLDSQLVAGIDVAQLRGSALYKEMVEPLLLKGKFAQELADVKAKCGFDPTTSVTTVTIGMKNADERNPEGIVVVHGIEKAKALACFEKQREEFAKEKVDVKIEGDVVILKQEGEVPSGITFINDTTGIVVIGPTIDAAIVKAATAGGGKLKTSAQFSDMHKKIAGGKSIWFLVNGNTPALAKGLAQLNLQAKAVFGSINVTDKVAGEMRMRLDSADKATEMAGKLRDGVGGMIEGFVDKLDFGSDGPDVKITGSASKDKLKTIASLLGMGKRAAPPAEDTP